MNHDVGQSAAPTVYTFPNFGVYLAAWSDWKRATDRRFSLRGLAKRAKRSPSLVTMIARGERQTTKEVGMDLCRAMGLDPETKKYAIALIEREHARSDDAREAAELKMRTFAPIEDDHVLGLDTFELVSQWYHTTIMEMTELKSFQNDPEWIADQLGTSVTPAMVEQSIALLQRLRLVAISAEGRLVKAHGRVRTSPNVPRAAIRSCHKQMIQRGYNSVERQTVDERFLSTLTFPIPEDRLNDARKMIVEFRDRFVSSLHDEEPPFDEVYHLNIQFFRATARPQTVDAKPIKRTAAKEKIKGATKR